MNKPILPKDAIRARAIIDRASLDPKRAAIWSALISDHVLSMEAIVSGKPVLSYVSSFKNEVDTYDLIRVLLHRNRTVLVPLCAPGQTLEWSRLQTLEDLEKTALGVYEPKPAAVEPVDPPDDSVALIPGVAFDTSGHRVGSGRGYYDRFLARYGGIKVGLAYAMQIVVYIPTASHDVAMDVLVTEEGAFPVRR